MSIYYDEAKLLREMEAENYAEYDAMHLNAEERLRRLDTLVASQEKLTGTCVRLCEDKDYLRAYGLALYAKHTVFDHNCFSKLNDILYECRRHLSPRDLGIV